MGSALPSLPCFHTSSSPLPTPLPREPILPWLSQASASVGDSNRVLNLPSSLNSRPLNAAPSVEPLHVMNADGWVCSMCIQLASLYTLLPHPHVSPSPGKGTLVPAPQLPAQTEVTSDSSVSLPSLPPWFVHLVHATTEVSPKCVPSLLLRASVTVPLSQPPPAGFPCVSSPGSHSNCPSLLRQASQLAVFKHWFPPWLSSLPNLASVLLSTATAPVTRGMLLGSVPGLAFPTVDSCLFVPGLPQPGPVAARCPLLPPMLLSALPLRACSPHCLLSIITHLCAPSPGQRMTPSCGS